MSWMEDALASVGKGNNEVGSATEPCPLSEGAIVVSVLRADTQEAIEGATVDLAGPSAKSGSTAGEFGTALFDPVDPGSYDVKVALKSDEFEDPEPKSISLSGGGTAVALFCVSPPGNLVVTVVKDSDQSPISAATVKLAGPSEAQAKTDDSGITKFDSIPSGGYTVSVSFTGSNKKAYEIPGDKSPFVEAGQDTELVIPVRAIEHWVEIELVDEEGNSFPEEKYSVELPDGSKITGKLDANGRAKVEGVSQSGTCKVSFPDLGHEMEVETQGG